MSRPCLAPELRQIRPSHSNGVQDARGPRGPFGRRPAIGTVHLDDHGPGGLLVANFAVARPSVGAAEPAEFDVNGRFILRYTHRFSKDFLRYPQMSLVVWTVSAMRPSGGSSRVNE